MICVYIPSIKAEQISQWGDTGIWGEHWEVGGVMGTVNVF